jgi:hypothetical protein
LQVLVTAEDAEKEPAEEPADTVVAIVGHPCAPGHTQNVGLVEGSGGADKVAARVAAMATEEEEEELVVTGVKVEPCVCVCLRVCVCVCSGELI